MATAKVIIKGEDQLKGPINQASQELNSFGQVAEKVGNTLKKAFVVGAIVETIKEITKAVGDCVNEFKNQIEVDTKLQAVIQATGQQYKTSAVSIKKYASELQDLTGIGDDVIESTAAMLLASKKFDEEGLERTISLAADVSYALGEDLPAAAKTLEKALLEPGEGLSRLKNIGITFTESEEKMIKSLKDAGNELEAQKLILDKVEASYGGVAKSIASVDTSTLDKIKNVWGDLKEDLGSVFTNLLGPVFTWVYNTLKELERFANRIANKVDFNTAVKQGNVTKLANNFETQYIRDMMSEYIEELFKGRVELEEDYKDIFDKLFNKLGIGLEDFFELTYEEQRETLAKIMPADQAGLTVNAWRQLYGDTYDMVLVMQRALTLQEQQTKISYNAAQAAEDAANAAKKAAGFSEETAKATNYAIQEMFNGGIDSFVTKILLGNAGPSATLNALYGRTTGQSFIDQLWHLDEFFGQNSSYNLDPLGIAHNMTLSAALAGSGTNAMSILGANGIKNLHVGLNLEDIEGVVNEYSSRSETFQANLIDKQIESVEQAIAALNILDSDSPLGIYLNEILKSLKKDKSGKSQTTDKSGEAWKSVLSDFTSQAGEFGEVVSKLVSNMTAYGPLLGAIITALHYVIQGFIEVFGDLLQDFAYYGLEPLRELGRVVGNVLMPLLEEFMPSIQQSASILIQIFDAIGVVLKPIAQLLGSVLGPVLKMITDFLEYILLPILKGIATIFLAVTSVCEFFADCVRWIVAEVKSWFGGGANRVRVRSYDEILEGHLNELWNGSNVGAYSTSGTTNASYQGTTTIYLNVFNQGYVVGEDGIQEFAVMIRNELENVNYFGR